MIRTRHDQSSSDDLIAVGELPDAGALSPIGVLLAGGRGARMGGGKLTAMLAGRPLFSYPLAVLEAALDDVVVVGKPGLMLPGIDAQRVWIEPAEPRHPLVGIVEALTRADGRAVLVCPADLPFISAELITSLARAPATGAPAVVVSADGALQPLLGRYEQAAVRLLAPAIHAQAPARAAVTAIGPRVLELASGDAEQLFNVNTPDELRVAQERLEAGHGGL